MYLKQDLNVIITIVARGFSDRVTESAKNAGAEGATIFNARGTGIHESDSILGVSIQPEKEVVMIVVRKNIRKKVMREICKNCGLNEEGKGLCFAMPIDELGGVSHLTDLVRNTKKRVSKPATTTKPTAKPTTTTSQNQDKAAQNEAQNIDAKNTKKIAKKSDKNAESNEVAEKSATAKE